MIAMDPDRSAHAREALAMTVLADERSRRPSVQAVIA